MSSVADEHARRTALDPERSFIVQAPAGSGKTELLIQRYLTLLATVREPEQIVAITFTRKAAAEMRSRVLRALAAAATGAQASHPHEELTLRLASAAVARDAALGWQLQAQPQRLRIDTLDALNVWLAQQLPILAGGIAGAGIVDDAAEQYRLAARRTLGELAARDAVGEALRLLARTFGNQLDTLESMLAELLPKRDQWLPHLLGSEDALRRDLETALEHLVAEEIDALAARWPKAERAATAAVLAHAAAHAESEPLRTALGAWQDLARWPTGRDALDAWRGAAEVLLTREGAWRRAGAKAHGLGAAHPAERRAFAALREALERDEALAPALADVLALPEPRYAPDQWGKLAALKVVLTRLAAELRVVFAEQRCVDFVELALAAQQALGRVDRPSELLLALDQRIQHLLVDEFQDTSHSQLQLLEILTGGWQPGDGRTLFLVGDPMQSIYRFRDADLTRFLNVKQRGLGAIRCETLTLERNFRSAPAVVDWINALFAGTFPRTDDPVSGAAAFSPCTAVRARSSEHGVQVHTLRAADGRAELRVVAELVRAELERDPAQAIGILVQSRTHLAGLHDYLLGHGWPVRAVEIESLTEQQIGQDLLGLTRALTHPADRIAWLALLRAPWCGLTWADLEALCGDERERTVWELLHDGTRLERLSADGRRRAEGLRGTLEAAAAERAGLPLAAWVERVFRRLDPEHAAAADAEERAAAERFFALLARHERGGQLDDPAKLEALLGAAQPAAAEGARGGVEILTMHRAKGLEFDTVILFGLGREPRREDAKALYWMERAAAAGEDELIMAPPAPDGSSDRLADFVRGAGRRRDLAERARLLYVATTRARDRLHLVCRLPPGRPAPTPASLLALLWPQLGASFPDAEAAEAPETALPAFEPVLLRRASPPSAAASSSTTAPLAETPPEYEWVSPAAVDVGTVVHRQLHRIAVEGVAHWNAARVLASRAVYRRELEMLGVDSAERSAATERVAAALCGVLEDSRGRWLLDNHAEAQSELALTEHRGGMLQHVRLDRTFVDAGTRWIVDFKTSSHEGTAVAAFIDAEVERYRPQLERYAEIVAALDRRPISVGLYFPLLKEFRAWEPVLRQSAVKEIP